MVEEILNECDPKKVKDLTYLFNLAQTKKSVLRAMSYNNLLDKVETQMEERLTKRADQFSNKDLLDYMDKISNAMDKNQKQIKDIDTTPAIQINQQNIIMDSNPELSRESRQNILDVVNAILKNAESPMQEDIIINNNDNQEIELIEELEEESVLNNDNDNSVLNNNDSDENYYLSEEDIINKTN